jgi:hypothetical protein
MTSSVLDALKRRPWTEEAECQHLGDDNTMFPDGDGSISGEARVASPALLLPLLLCAKCPVRRECLTEALTPVSYTTRETTTHEYTSRSQRDEVIEKASLRSQLWLFGVWGGTHEWERWALRSLPLVDAVDRLEEGFSERLSRRIDAYTRHRQHGPQRSRQAITIIDEMLAERSGRVGRFEQGNPGGPGRGHRGRIALLAEELGVSRSTAWRRLQAS